MKPQRLASRQADLQDLKKSKTTSKPSSISSAPSFMVMPHLITSVRQKYPQGSKKSKTDYSKFMRKSKYKKTAASKRSGIFCVFFRL